jgi:hypothetical protein
MKKRFLIFTAAYGSDLLPTAFLQSARQADIQADIILLRHKRDWEVEQELQRYYPATYVFAPLRHRFLRVVRRALLSTRLVVPVAKLTQAVWMRSRILRNKIETFIPYLLGIMVSRFFLARLYLVGRENEYSAVLLIDSRDVVFQRNPLEDFEGGLLAGVENCTIENQLQNREWLQKIYGESPEALDELWPKKVICAGVTLGTTSQVLSYLNLMCAEFIEQLPRLAYLNYLDQAVHNKILYSGHHNLDLRLTDNSKGSIVHLATSDLSEFEDDWTDGLRMKDGRIVSIVHQYDRHPELMRILLERLESNL